MRPAAAKIIVHAGDDILFRGRWVFRQQAEGIQDHARGAKTALQGILGHERLLQRMQGAVLSKAFDGQNLLSLYLFDRDLA